MSSIITFRRKSLHINRMTFFYLILSLYALNFMGVGDYIALVVVPYTLLSFSKMSVTKNFMFSVVTLSAFGLLFSFFTFYYGFGTPFSIVGKLIYPIVFLILGYKLVGDEVGYKGFNNFLMLFVVIMSAYGFLSVFKTGYMYGGLDNAYRVLKGRLTIDLWGNNLISATVLNSFLSLGLAVLPLLFLSVRKKEITKKSKFILFGVFVCSTYSTLQIGSRTGILIIFTSLFVSFLLSEKTLRKKIRKSFSFGISAMIVLFLYSLNVFNVKTMVENSSAYNRLITTSLEEESRFKAWQSVFEGIFKNPLGGRKTDFNLGFAHNMWLDVGYDAGLIPFLILVVFSIASFLTIRRFLRDDHPIFLRTLVLSMSVAFFIIFMFEPILQGYGVYFTVYCFFIGSIYKANKQNQTAK